VLIGVASTDSDAGGVLAREIEITPSPDAPSAASSRPGFSPPPPPPPPPPLFPPPPREPPSLSLLVVVDVPIESWYVDAVALVATETTDDPPLFRRLPLNADAYISRSHGACEP